MTVTFTDPDFNFFFWFRLEIILLQMVNIDKFGEMSRDWAGAKDLCVLGLIPYGEENTY